MFSMIIIIDQLKRATGNNSTYPKGGVTYSKDSFVVNGKFVSPSLPRDYIAWYSTLHDNNDTLQHSFLSGIIGSTAVNFKVRIYFHSNRRCNRAGAGITLNIGTQNDYSELLTSHRVLM